MHELSVAIGIVDGVLEELRRRGAAEVCAVHLRLGRLSGVDKDALLFCYGVACEKTPLARSRLVVEDVDVVIFCPECGAEGPTRSFPTLACAACGALAGRLLHGHELEVSAMELVT